MPLRGISKQVCLIISAVRWPLVGFKLLHKQVTRVGIYETRVVLLIDC